MPLSPLHYLNAGAANGKFQTKGDYPSSPEQVDQLFEHLEKTKAPRLALYFHGGLVPTKKGLEIAENMVGVLGGVTHPVSVVWETGAVRTLIDDFSVITESDLFKDLRDWVLKKLGENLGGLGGVKGKASFNEKTLEEGLQKRQPFEERDEPSRKQAEKFNQIQLAGLESRLEAELKNELKTDTRLTQRLLIEGAADPKFDQQYVPDPNAQATQKGVISLKVIKSLVKVTIRVVKRFMDKTDHGFYPTVVEEVARQYYLGQIGAGVWKEIKQKAENLWADNTGLAGKAQHAGRYFLDQLNKHKQNKPEFTVDLIGHSAGSIAICHLLRMMEMHATNLLPVRHIIFLAPACRVDLFEAEMMRKNHRFDRFRMFTMEEDYEKKDYCGSYLYPRSLLYLIAGLLENEPGDYILGLEEQLKDREPYNQSQLLLDLRNFLEVDNRLALSVSKPATPPGMRTEAKKHGDFDDDDATRKSMAAFILMP